MNESLSLWARKIIRENATQIAENGIVRLKEKENKMTVELNGVPCDATVINVNKFGQLDKILKKEKVKCDFLLLFGSAVGDVAVFVEMKKTIREENKPFRQLRSSKPYLDFLISECSIRCSNALPSLTVYYVIIGEKRPDHLPKERTSPPGVLPDKEFHGIIVHRRVGKQFSLRRLYSMSE